MDDARIPVQVIGIVLALRFAEAMRRGEPFRKHVLTLVLVVCSTAWLISSR